jgi:transposase
LHDAGLAAIGRQLACKLAWRDGTLIQASTLYRSSKTCGVRNGESQAVLARADVSL